MGIGGWSDESLIQHALLQWRNYIETGDVTTSAEDLRNMGQWDTCKDLSESQIAFTSRLENLAKKAIGN